MPSVREHGSQRDLLNLLDSGTLVDQLNEVLLGAETILSASDCHRPLSKAQPQEYELPRFCRELFSGHFDQAMIDSPHWWIAKQGRFVQTPNFDLLSTATVLGGSGLLLVEAKAHHNELETAGKPLDATSSTENHAKIQESITMANGALNGAVPAFASVATASIRCPIVLRGHGDWLLSAFLSHFFTWGSSTIRTGTIIVRLTLSGPSAKGTQRYALTYSTLFLPQRWTRGWPSMVVAP
ncbi:MAG: hypothetical protein ACLQOO_28645 [Terriglobia bacterium]